MRRHNKLIFVHKSSVRRRSVLRHFRTSDRISRLIFR